MSTRPASKPLKPHYPVLIIGAGINGCGTFRDLSLQGIDCLMIDRGDICEGASAAPSRLIHGGIKYLETGEFRLVRESAMERNRLLRNAPHYVKPLETVLPAKSWFAGLMPSALRFLGFKTKLKDRGGLICEAGLRIYDAYNRRIRVLPDHRLLRSTQLHREYPDFDKKIIAAGLYYEGRITHAERLGLELALDGLAANPGSALLSYARVTPASTPELLRITCQFSGETTEVTADVIINAGGAWIDEVNAGLGIKSSHIGGSKGSHLIVRNKKLHDALQGRMIYFGMSDGRVNLVYPFFGNVLIGSTDIPVETPDEAACSAEEQAYLLASVQEIFPGIRVTPDQVLLTYCGVRPLPRSVGTEIGAVSRDHAIACDTLPGTAVPVLSLVGGKWTTFRAFSAQVADDVLRRLGKRRLVMTEDLPIGGGKDYPTTEDSQRAWVARIAGQHGLSLSRANTLLMRYGTRAEQVARFIASQTDTALATLPGYSAREIAYVSAEENVHRLADILFRRTAIAMEGLLMPAAIEEVAGVAAHTLGWSVERSNAEIAHSISELTRRRPVSPPTRKAA